MTEHLAMRLHLRHKSKRAKSAGIYSRVRTWLMTGPGAYFAASPEEVLRMAHASAGGLAMSVNDFADCLRAEAYQPYPLGRRWVLSLPDRPNK